MSIYAVYSSSRIYHLMTDENHTKCGVSVFASSDQGARAVSKIVESIPDELRLCPHCSGERNEKEGGKK